MDRLEELFGEEGGQPEPRRRLILGLLIPGLLLALVGMACSAAPGGLMVLASWSAVENELDRVESGYLPLDVAPELRRLRSIILGCLAFVVLLFFLQLNLLGAGFYDALWADALTRLVGDAP